MLLLSTRPDNLSLINLAGHLLQETPSMVQEAVELSGMFRAEKSSWDVRLRVANMLLDNGQINRAKEMITAIDAAEYFQQATSAGQVNLLFSVLIRTDKGDEALFLLKSVNIANRFSVFDNMDIRLMVANMLLSQGQTKKADEFINGLDAAKYFEQAASAGQINLLLRVLVLTDKGDEALSLLESANMAERFSVFDGMDIRLRVANALLAQGQIDQAKELIADLDPVKFIKHASNAAQIKLLFNLVAYFQRSAEILRLLEDVKIIRLFGGETLIDLKLNIVNKLIMQGQRQAAKKILTSINPESLSNNDHAGLLGLAYIQLSMFDQALHVFGVAERKGHIHPDLSVYMSILFLCLGEVDKAKEYIDKYTQSNKRTPSNLLWKATLLNYSGQHAKALHQIDVLLSNFSSNYVHQCFGFVEKGNTLRLLANYEEANVCYQKAQETRHGATFWLWIACFEHAMTLVYLDKTEEALTAARNGCTYKSHMYSEKYNPCVILYHFLLYRQNRSKEFFISPVKLAENAKLWPFSHMPHKIWMLLLTAIVLEEQCHTQTAKGVIGEIINYSTINELGQRGKQKELLYACNNWRDKRFLEILFNSIGILSIHSFEYRMLLKMLMI